VVQAKDNNARYLVAIEYDMMITHAQMINSTSEIHHCSKEQRTEPRFIMTHKLFDLALANLAQ